MSRFQEDIHERKPSDLSHIGFCLKSPEQIECFKKSFCDDPDRKDSLIKMLVTVPANIQILCESRSVPSNSFMSLLFKAGWQLQRIEECAFSPSGLKSIIIQASVEILCKSCLSPWLK
jgi:hypothetical protein